MKKTVAPGAKTPLFDRIFKPELITLENGHTVTRPRSRTPLIALLVFAALAISVHVTGFNLAIIAKRANQIAGEMKRDLDKKLQEFASLNDNLEEISENREQIEISKYYEKLPKPTLIATQEYMDGKIFYRNPAKEKLALDD